MRPGESLSRSEPRCIGEIAPKRACWRTLSFSGRSQLCPEHAGQMGIVMAVHLAWYNRSVRAWNRERWTCASDVPWD